MYERIARNLRASLKSIRDGVPGEYAPKTFEEAKARLALIGEVAAEALEMADDLEANSGKLPLKGNVP